MKIVKITVLKTMLNDFKTLVDYFGSYALVEITLMLMVVLPTLAVYKFTKE